MPGKERLDVILHQRGLATSRERARAMILAGLVAANGRPLTKAGAKHPADIDLEVRGEEHPYVSRGGLKLAAALERFSDISLDGAVALDIGAGTGGFTDVLLRAGAKKVYAVDVGHGQLAQALRDDGRVVVLEKTNARDLNTESINDTPDVVVCDVSFISLRKALPASLELLRPGGVLAALIKPQFEVGKGNVGKGGVVSDPALHQSCQDDVRDWLERGLGWEVRGIVPSPITGSDGNTEFIIVALKPG